MRGFIRATGQRDCFLPITSMQCSLSTHVPTTFLHVPPWLSKRFMNISFVPIRSEQPSRSFRKTCTQIIRSYTFCATLPQIRKNMYSNHTFLYVLSNPLAVLAWCHTFLHVPITFLHVLPMNLKKHIVFLTFLQVPCNSIAKAYSRWKTRNGCSTVSQKNAGGAKGTHPGGSSTSGAPAATPFV